MEQQLVTLIGEINTTREADAKEWDKKMARMKKVDQECKEAFEELHENRKILAEFQQRQSQTLSPCEDMTLHQQKCACFKVDTDALRADVKSLKDDVDRLGRTTTTAVTRTMDVQREAAEETKACKYAVASNEHMLRNHSDAIATHEKRLKKIERNTKTFVDGMFVGIGIVSAFILVGLVYRRARK